MTTAVPARPDPLRFLSAARETCRVCGETIRFCEEPEQAVWWVACKCGHVFPTVNRIRWQ